MSKHRNVIDEPFFMHRLSMLESPAFRVLTRAARMILDRIEIEHMHHGGGENGHLTVTYDDFERYGMHRHTIGPGLRELAALGFIEITERGYAGNREFRSPSKYRLTYTRAKNSDGTGTHEWRFVQSCEQAEEIAKRARDSIDESGISVRRKRKTDASKNKNPMAENATFQCRKTSSTHARSRWRKSSPRSQ
jgi:hypothetical protein